MTYAKLMRRRAALTRTENGAAALNTTGDSRLDFFSTVGALREADEKRILFTWDIKLDLAGSRSLDLSDYQ